MRRAQGYAVMVSPDEPMKEWDTRTCGHCQKLEHIKPFMDAADIEYGGQCKMCMRYICRECYERVINGDGCDVFEKKLERIEAAAKFKKDAGLVG